LVTSVSISAAAGMPASGSWSFGCFVTATTDLVWAALTDAEQTGSYLYGLAVHSTWVPGAPIDLRLRDESVLVGQVLCAKPGRRLSYLVRAAHEDEPVYLTWLIRSSPGGATIRIQIDEIENADDDERAENVWLPVLAALQRRLGRPVG
jgi:uncharacterized protein YndB with AHSA1/START domain